MRHIRSAGRSKSGSTTVARRVAGWITQPEACALVGGLVFATAINEPTSRLNEKWELTIGAGAMLAAFLVVFLIQNGPIATDAEVVP